VLARVWMPIVAHLVKTVPHPRVTREWVPPGGLCYRVGSRNKIPQRRGPQTKPRNRECLSASHPWFRRISCSHPNIFSWTSSLCTSSEVTTFEGAQGMEEAGLNRAGDRTWRGHQARRYRSDLRPQTGDKPTKESAPIQARPAEEPGAKQQRRRMTNDEDDITVVDTPTAGSRRSS
jgi:hypothetical protein